jgi:heme A synthase
MNDAELHRSAVLVAISVLILIAIGSYISSRANAPQPPSLSVINARFHTMVAVAVGILALCVAVAQSRTRERYVLVWTALALFAVTAWVGWLGWPLLHASLAPLAFAIMVAIAVVTSSGWNEAPEIVDGQAAPLLRPLAIAAPPVVLLQIVLGAAYHHRLTGVIPHMGGAMVASLTTLVAAMLVMQQYPRHRALRSAARWLMSIVLIQITLGVMAFSMQLLDVENWMALVIATASHAVVGSVTLAASMVLAMQVQRSVHRALHYQSTSTADSVKVRHSMDY